MNTTEITNSEDIEIPSNFSEVTLEQFYKKIGPTDVHPRPAKLASYWETPSHQLRGISTPGYMCSRGGKYTTEHRYYLPR